MRKPVAIRGVARMLGLGLWLMGGSAALAASCGDTAQGFESWKAAFAQEAAAEGVGAHGLQALDSARYAARTIAADRNQKSFRYNLEKFMQVRGADTIVAQGRKRRVRDAAFYDALERQYGVPAGILIAIHGMETAFGGFMGDTSVVSAIVTLASRRGICRGPAQFRRNRAMERGHGLSTGDRADGGADRRKRIMTAPLCAPCSRGAIVTSAKYVRFTLTQTHRGMT
jgi:membrane-bound lytic murein transglycosylase B